MHFSMALLRMFCLGGSNSLTSGCSQALEWTSFPGAQPPLGPHSGQRVIRDGRAPASLRFEFLEMLRVSGTLGACLRKGHCLKKTAWAWLRPSAGHQGCSRKILRLKTSNRTGERGLSPPRPACVWVEVRECLWGLRYFLEIETEPGNRVRGWAGTWR